MSTDTTPKTGLYALEVGDRVQVFDINGRRMGQPAGGWDGTVVKVGRKLITVQYQSAHNTKAFRLDSGSANDDYGHQHVRTVEQATADLRRAEALRRLRDAGVTIECSRINAYSTQTLEALAAVLDSGSAGPGLSGGTPR
jgi:hypothetical protein